MYVCMYQLYVIHTSTNHPIFTYGSIKVQGAKNNTYELNVSQSLMLYYLELFLMEKECPGPWSDR